MCMHAWMFAVCICVCVCVCVCVCRTFHLPVTVLKVNVYTDNGDDVLESVLVSVGESQLHCITELISMMEQAP